MTQDQLWINRYIQIRDFMEVNHRKPSKHNPKILNAGEMKAERVKISIFRTCY